MRHVHSKKLLFAILKECAGPRRQHEFEYGMCTKPGESAIWPPPPGHRHAFARGHLSTPPRFQAQNKKGGSLISMWEARAGSVWQAPERNDQQFQNNEHRINTSLRVEVHCREYQQEQPQSTGEHPWHVINKNNCKHWLKKRRMERTARSHINTNG